MENSNEANCTCTFLHFNYQINKSGIPSSTSLLKSKNNLQTPGKKCKVSLSRSISGLLPHQSNYPETINYSRVYPVLTGGYERCNIYQEVSDCPKPKVPQPKLRKKYVNSQIRTEKPREKYNSDLQKTKNTTFDNSTQYIQRMNQDKRVPNAVSFSFFDDKNSDSKVHRNSKLLAKQCREKQNWGLANPDSNRPTNMSRFQQEGRRIKTLKQLEYRNVQSSGGGTSENHVSMIMSASDAKSEELKELDRLARKSSSFTRIPKTTHVVV